jgi:hypothetical protein
MINYDRKYLCKKDWSGREPGGKNLAIAEKIHVLHDKALLCFGNEKSDIFCKKIYFECAVECIKLSRVLMQNLVNDHWVFVKDPDYLSFHIIDKIIDVAITKGNFYKNSSKNDVKNDVKNILQKINDPQLSYVIQGIFDPLLKTDFCSEDLYKVIFNLKVLKDDIFYLDEILEKHIWLNIAKLQIIHSLNNEIITRQFYDNQIIVDNNWLIYADIIINDDLLKSNFEFLMEDYYKNA